LLPDYRSYSSLQPMHPPQEDADGSLLNQLHWLPSFLRLYCEFSRTLIWQPSQADFRSAYCIVADMMRAVDGHSKSKSNPQPLAMTLLGWCYSHGLAIACTVKALEDAKLLWLAAADQGCLLASYLYSLQFGEHKGMDKLAEQNFCRAQLAEATRLREEWKLKEALALVQKALAQGCVLAHETMGDVELQYTCRKKNAMKEFEKAVEYGSPEARVKLAALHEAIAVELRRDPTFNVGSVV